MPENPTAKPGYNLIFQDDFTGFDASAWDKSSPGDDNCSYNGGTFCQSGNYDCRVPKNESNVLGTDGNNLLIQLREGEDQNLCSHSSGEVKTFDGVDGSAFPDWEIDPNSFLEVRVRFPECYDAGIGCAGWLWHYNDQDKYSEIDIWEIDGNRPDFYQSNFHWGEGSGGSCSSFALWSENIIFSCQEPDEIEVEDLQGNNFNFSDHFLTFGVEWDYNGIKYWLNNEETKFVGLNSFPYKRVHPYRLRLNTGAALHAGVTECLDLPQQMEVDYVRVYKKAGFRAVRQKSAETLTLCAGGSSGTGLYLSYYPNAVYTISIPTSAALAGQPGLCYAQAIAEPDRMAWCVLANPGTPIGVHTVTVQIAYPGGYTETVVQPVNVTSGMPPAPTSLFLAAGNNAFYLPVTSVQTNTDGYEWTIDGHPQNWTRIPNKPGQAHNYGPPVRAESQAYTYTVCVRAYNSCGVSAAYCQQVTVPAIGDVCAGCPQMPLPPRDIAAEQIGSSQFYELITPRTISSVAYQWSYDRNDWYSVSNIENDTFNRFGSYAAGSPPLLMYVRAVFPHDTSEIYSQEVTFPPATELLLAPKITGKAPAHEPAADRSNREAEASRPTSHTLVFDWSGRLVARLAGPEPDLAVLRQRGVPAGFYVLAACADDGSRVGQRKIFLTGQN